MRESFMSFILGLWKHSWGFWVGFILAALDIAERIWPDKSLSELPAMLGWVVLALGVLYAAYRAYHDLWTAIPKNQRQAAGFLPFYDAADHLLTFIDEDVLQQWDYSQYDKPNWARLCLDTIADEGQITLYERTGEKYRKIEYSAAKHGKLSFADDALNSYFVRKRDIKRGWKRFTEKTIMSRIKKIISNPAVVFDGCKNGSAKRNIVVGREKAFLDKDGEDNDFSDNLAISDDGEDTVGYEVKGSKRTNLQGSVAMNFRKGFSVTDSEDTDLRNTVAKGNQKPNDQSSDD